METLEMTEPIIADSRRVQVPDCQEKRLETEHSVSVTKFREQTTN